MAGLGQDIVSPFGPLQAELARMRKSNLTAAIQDVDKIIDYLMAAREQVAAGMRSAQPLDLWSID
jgi:hypothetical protein